MIAFIIIPDKTYTEVEFDLTAFAIKRTDIVAIIPPKKEPRVIDKKLLEVNKTIATAEPKFAPFATPIISGEASGFLKTVWQTEPLNPNAIPQIKAKIVRGSLKRKKTFLSISVEEPKIIFSGDKEYFPIKRESIKRTKSIEIVIVKINLFLSFSMVKN